jgi:hypothetical protein
MSAYKQFLSSDIIVTPFEVNKSFTFTGANQLTGSIVGIDRFIGTNLSGTLFNPNTDPTTGQVSTQYRRLIYSSIQELYYSNYLSSSYGSPATTQSLFPGNNPSGDVYIGPSNSSGRYFNYNQSTLTFEKYFPTSSNSLIGVMSVPSKLYGNYIQPGSFIWQMTSGSLSGSIYDDSEGNLILSSSNEICGQIFYPHGLAIITTSSNASNIINGFVTASNVVCSFSSSITIYETQYKCTIRDNEYNFTLNPSISSGSTQISASNGTFFTPGQYLYSFSTASYFNPYVTTVGLYDDNQNLIAVGKLSQPLPLSPTTDTTILINLDR